MATPTRPTEPMPSPELLVYAGLGVLRDQGGRSFDRWVDRGRSWVGDPKPEGGVAEPAAVYGSVPATPYPSLSSSSSSSSMAQVIEALMPPTVPTAPMVLQARRNSLARTELMNEFGLLTSAEVAEINQSQAENRAALASRWKGEGRIFAVSHQGRDYFPGFQFEIGGRPRAMIADVLEALGGARGWQTALWFTGANGYLDDRRPVDVIDDDPDAVVDAARHEGTPVYF